MQTIDIEQSQLLSLIGQMYDASTDVRKWRAFLANLTAYFDGNGAQVVHINPAEERMTFSILYGYDEHVLKHFGSVEIGSKEPAFEKMGARYSELMSTDPRVAVFNKFPNRAFSCRDFIDEQEFHDSEMYKQINGPFNVEYSLMVVSPSDGHGVDGLAVFRGKEAQKFSAADVEAFSTLVPHLKRSMILHRELAFLSSELNIQMEALDALPIGVAFMDENLLVRRLNRAARDIFQTSRELMIKNDRICCTDEVAENAISEVVSKQDLNFDDDVWPPAKLIDIARESGSQAYSILISPVSNNPSQADRGAFSGKLFIVFVIDPDRTHEAPHELLQRMFGLTPAEGRLLALLVRGSTLKQSALALGITYNTARAHLRIIFEKTGTKRQAALLQLVLSNPLWVAALVANGSTLDSIDGKTSP